MQITFVTFTALTLATVISVSLATPIPFPASTGNNSDGTLQQLNPTLDAGDDAPHKSWNWNHVTVGECNQEEGRLKIYQDGRLQWDAIVWQSRVLTASIWHSTFQLKNSAGQVLYSAGPYHSPMMSPDMAHYDWHVNDHYEADVYNQTVWVTQWSRC